MLDSQTIQKLKSGAYGVMRDGHKCRYIGITPLGQSTWVMYDYKDCVIKSINFDNFDTYYKSRSESDYDVIGLWSKHRNKFNLEKALAGQKVKLRNGETAVVLAKVPDEANVYSNTRLIGYTEPKHNKGKIVTWSLDGEYNIGHKHRLDIFGMK